MFKFFRILSLKEKLYIFILITIGAISEPLIAYSYILLGNKISDIDSIGFKTNLPLIIGLIIFALVIAGINYIGIDLLMNNIVTLIRKKSFKEIISKESSEIIQTERANFYNDILKKIDIWKFRYLKSVIDIIEKITELFFAILIITYIDYRVTFTVIVFMIPLIINNIFFPKKMNKVYDDYLAKDTEQLNKMKEYLDALLIIKNNNEEKEYYGNMSKIFDEQNRLWKKLSILNNLSATIANTGVILSQVSGVLISLFFYYNGTIALGSFMALIQLTMFINRPVIDIINATIGVNSVKNVNEYVEKIFKEKEDYKEEKNFSLENINISNLNYSYNGIDNVFENDLNINFKKGKKYLIIGESGRGKSTLLKILMKYLKNYYGEITFNDIPLENISEKVINENIFYIPQKIIIFNDTIKNNVDIKNQYTNENILKVINEFKLDKIVDNEKLLDTMIGEEINTLSGGEASRLYMVKAKLSNKKIIIADEILANLDNKNSLNVEKILLSFKDKTVIHISHNYNEELYDKYDYVIKL